LYCLDAEHVTQSELCGPVQVPQSEWQATHDEPNSKKPSLHVEIQVDSWRMGVLPALAHDVQLVDDPRHVWQVALQFRHTLAPSESALR